MPKGPKGQKRPADVIGNAVKVMRIATEQDTDTPSKAPNRAKGGILGGRARAEGLSATERKRIAKKAAQSRWGNKTK